MTAWWIAATLAVMALWAPATQAAVPANDDFANRELLGGSLPIEVTRSNVDATKELSWEEVGSFAAGHSVWFEWQATTTGWVTVDACTGTFPTVLGLFTGTETIALTRITHGNASEGPECPDSGRVYTFRAVGGTHYDIGVDGNGFYLPEWPKPVTEGTFRLRIEATPPPPNDDFADATPLSGPIYEEPGGRRIYWVNSNGYNWGASEEAGEPEPGGDPGGASVWYQWTAPESGQVGIGTCCQSEPLVALYTGSSLGSLAPVASVDEPFTALRASVTAGTTYWIQVDGRDQGSEPAMFGFQLQIQMQLAPGPGQQPTDSGTPNPFESVPGAIVSPAPQTRLGKRTVRQASREATFRFSSNQPGVTYRCKLDRGPYRPCSSPATYRHLTFGPHTFRAFSLSPSGGADATPVVAHLSIPRPR